jgi:hypothetical protein
MNENGPDLPIKGRSKLQTSKLQRRRDSHLSRKAYHLGIFQGITLPHTVQNEEMALAWEERKWRKHYQRACIARSKQSGLTTAAATSSSRPTAFVQEDISFWCQAASQW